MDLRQLRYFQAACRVGNITRAAEQLGVSQPSVTTGIKRLEEELGVRLLSRDRKRISITADGRAFLRRADTILMLASDSAAEMRDRRSQHEGVIRLGITPMLGSVLLPAAFAHFQQEHPRVQVSVVEEGSLSLSTHLKQGELDIGIMIISDLPAGLASVPVSQGPICVCLPLAHPLAKQTRIALDMLRDQPLILFGEDTYTRRAIEERCSRNGFEPRVVFTSSQIGTVIGLVRQGVGIAFFIEEIARSQESIAVRAMAEPLELRTGLAWTKERYLTRAARAFIESFRSGLHTAAGGSRRVERAPARGRGRVGRSG
jgi:DNA-binding transcriptional LysR family regulator